MSFQPWGYLALAAAVAAGARAQQEPVFSGPQVGEKVTPFAVQRVTGPEAGKQLRLLDGSADPVVLVFVHQIERSIVPLLSAVDEYGWDRRQVIRTHFVFLGEDRVQMEQRLPLVTRSLRLMAPAYYSLDGGEGPGNYGLNKRCLVTILLARESRVTANFALTQPGIADAPKVLAEMAKLAGAPEPPQVEALQQQRRNRLAADPAVRTDQRRGGDRPDLANLNLETADGMRAALRALIAEVQSLRAELAALRGERGTRRDAPEAKRDQPRRELPGAAPTDERLISLLRSFIQPTNTDAAVDRVLGETEQYVKGNPDLTKQAINGWVRVLAIPYGTPYAQKAGQTFVEKLKKGL